jgi:hypothetical protein
MQCVFLAVSFIEVALFPVHIDNCCIQFSDTFQLICTVQRTMFLRRCLGVLAWAGVRHLGRRDKRVWCRDGNGSGSGRVEQLPACQQRGCG